MHTTTHLGTGRVPSAGLGKRSVVAVSEEHDTETKREIMQDIAEVVDGVDPQEYEMSEYFDRDDLIAIKKWIVENDPEI
jgi:hypothetical protein